MTKRFSGLEVLRFIAAVAVITWHYENFLLPGRYTPETGQLLRSVSFPFDHLLHVFYTAGYYAVQLFWLLSGYIFFWKYRRAIAQAEISISQFFVFRFSRLYPLHISTLAIVAVLQAVYVRMHGTSFEYGGNDAGHFLLQLVMASDWFSQQPLTFNGPIWSVSVEVLVYLIFFIAAISLRNDWICALVPLFIAREATIHLPSEFIFDRNVPVCCVFFFAGGAVYLVTKRVLQLKYVKTGLAVGCVVAAIAMSDLPLPIAVLDDNRILLACGASVFAIAMTDAVFGHDWLRPLAWLGNLTYSSYLLHFPLQLVFLLMTDAMGYDRHIYLSHAAFVTFMLTTFTCSALVYYRFEKPAQDALRVALLGAPVVPAKRAIVAPQ